MGIKGWIGLMEDLEDKLAHELPTYLLDEEGNPIVFDIEDQLHQKRLEYLREYTKQPYVKAKRKSYNELPGMKEKVKQYNKEYYQRRKKEKNDIELEKISLKRLTESQGVYS